MYFRVFNMLISPCNSTTFPSHISPNQCHQIYGFCINPLRYNCPISQPFLRSILHLSLLISNWWTTQDKTHTNSQATSHLACHPIFLIAFITTNSYTLTLPILSINSFSPFTLIASHAPNHVMTQICLWTNCRLEASKVPPSAASVFGHQTKILLLRGIHNLF